MYLSEECQRGGRSRTVDGNPFHDVDIFGQHDYRLEVALDERRVCERAAEVEGFGDGSIFGRRRITPRLRVIAG